jgi:murein DD-endopeptidase / murein LD-carboxypeptidase
MIGGDAAAARALGELGTPFRLHGRQPGIALDCVGLAAHALGLQGAPVKYNLKGAYESQIEIYMDMLRADKLPPDAASRNGDLAMVQAAPRQNHLMIHANLGWVHAHAGLRRVVHMPGPSPWLIISLWRLGSKGD